MYIIFLWTKENVLLCYTLQLFGFVSWGVNCHFSELLCKESFFFFKIQCELLTFCFVLFSVLYQTDVFGSKPPVICTRFCKLFDIIEQISFTDLSLVLYSFNITDIYFLIHSIKSYQFYILKPLGRNIYFRSFYQFRAGLHEMTQWILKYVLVYMWNIFFFTPLLAGISHKK